MNKTNRFATLGIFMLFGFMIVFCQWDYEERNPEAIIVKIRPKVIIQKIEPLAVTMTAYSPSPAQTDSKPWETASRLIVTPQDLDKLLLVAVSRNLLKRFNPDALLEYGDPIFIEFIVVDTMHERWTNSVDIFMRDEKLVGEEHNLPELFGRQPREIIILEEEK